MEAFKAKTLFKDRPLLLNNSFLFKPHPLPITRPSRQMLVLNTVLKKKDILEWSRWHYLTLSKISQHLCWYSGVLLPLAQSILLITFNIIKIQRGKKNSVRLMPIEHSWQVLHCSVTAEEFSRRGAFIGMFSNYLPTKCRVQIYEIPSAGLHM